MISKKYLKDNGYSSIEELFAEILRTGEGVELLSQRQKNAFDQFIPEEPKIIQDLRSQGYIPVLWHKNDIRMAMRETFGKVDNIVVDKVYDGLKSKFDPSVGINWNVIKEEIDNQVRN